MFSSAGTSMLASGAGGGGGYGGGGGGRRRENEGGMLLGPSTPPVTDPYPVPNPRGFSRPGWRNEFQFRGTRHFGELEAAEIVTERESGRIGYVAGRGGDHGPYFSTFEPFNINSLPLVDLDVPLPDSVYERPSPPQLSCVGRLCKKVSNTIFPSKPKKTRSNRKSNRRSNRKSLRRRRH